MWLAISPFLTLPHVGGGVEIKCIHLAALTQETKRLNRIDNRDQPRYTQYTVDSRYYDICYNEILLITIPNLYPNHSQTIEIQTGYIDSLVILIHFPYPISIVITRVYCSTKESPHRYQWNRVIYRNTAYYNTKSVSQPLPDHI